MPDRSRRLLVTYQPEVNDILVATVDMVCVENDVTVAAVELADLTLLNRHEFKIFNAPYLENDCE